MSDICSAIHDDIQNYIRLCHKYGEKVVYSDGWVEDCYGKHAKKLEKREKSEIERSYCLGCREEIMTESGQLCEDCIAAIEKAKKAKEKKKGKVKRGKS